MSSPAVFLILWRDVFVVVDSGRAQPAEYEPLGALIHQQAKKYPAGLGGLVIVPESATPPSDAARRKINQILVDLGPQLRCLCWLVESTGFQAAMTRAVLTGLRVLSRLPYPTQIATSMDAALAWILPHLEKGIERKGQIPVASAWIRSQRMAPSLGA